MTYYIKENLFSSSGRYKILDENSKVCFETSEKLFSFTNSLILMDHKERELLTIIQLKGTALPEYKIMKDSDEMALIKKNFTDITDNLSISSLYGVFRVQGDSSLESYKIIDDLGNTAALAMHGHFPSISSKDEVLTQEPVYTLDILDKKRTSFLVALSIIINDIKNIDDPVI